MTELSITKRTAACDFGALCWLSEGITRRRPGTGNDVQNEPEWSGTSERESCSSNGAVLA